MPLKCFAIGFGGFCVAGFLTAGILYTATDVFDQEITVSSAGPLRINLDSNFGLAFGFGKYHCSNISITKNGGSFEEITTGNSYKLVGYVNHIQLDDSISPDVSDFVFLHDCRISAPQVNAASSPMTVIYGNPTIISPTDPTQAPRPEQPWSDSTFIPVRVHPAYSAPN